MKQNVKSITVSRNKSRIRCINQYDLDGHFIRSFDSIAEAKRTNPKFSNITHAIKRKGTSGGFQWRYSNEKVGDIEPYEAQGKKVIKIDPITSEFLAEYSSLKNAERSTGISSKQIWKSCNRQHITAGGFIWRYKDDSYDA